MSHKKQSIALIVGMVTAFVFFAAPVMSAEFPTKPITLIVPWPPGGATDLSLRALIETAGKHLPQPIVIENKPGGTGTVGPSIVASSAKPDGYTVVQIPPAVFSFPHTMKVTWDPLKDFTFIVCVIEYTSGLIVKPDAPWKTLPEFIDYAKANPNKVSYATNGAWGSLHIFMEKLALKEGIKWNQIPMKGDQESIPAVMGGHVSTAASTSAWAPQVDSGQIRLLATFGNKRTTRWPDVPTVKEFYGVSSRSAFGIAGPKGMDPKVVQILHDAFKKGLEDPAFKANLNKLGMESAYMNTGDYAKHAREEYEERGKEAEQFDLKKKIGGKV